MIVAVDPPKYSKANSVLVDSDARDNRDALHEIEDWAGDHGFARTKEYYLMRIHRRDGKNVFRGVCYRLTADVVQSIGADNRRQAKRLRKMPVTPHLARSDS